MKKRIFAIVAALMIATAPAIAQIFIDDEDNIIGREGTPTFGAMIPEQDVAYDQYVPVGESLFLLAGLAGAYLIGKKHKKD